MSQLMTRRDDVLTEFDAFFMTSAMRQITGFRSFYDDLRTFRSKEEEEEEFKVRNFFKVGYYTPDTLTISSEWFFV